MKNLTELTALTELNSKFNLGLDLPQNEHVQLLMSMYHIGIDLMYEYCKPEYLVYLYSIPRKKWEFYLEDLNALLTQVTEKNYHILYNDIQEA